VNWLDPRGLQKKCPEGSSTCVDVIEPVPAVIPFPVFTFGICIIDGQVVMDSFMCTAPILSPGAITSDSAHDAVLQTAHNAAIALRMMADVRDDLRRAIRTPGAISPHCQNKLAQIAYAGRDFTIEDLNQSIYSAGIFPVETGGGAVTMSMASGTDNGQTVLQFFDSNPNVTALASSSLNSIFFRSTTVSQSGWTRNFSLLLHEYLHLATGLSDSGLQIAFGLTVQSSTSNITDFLEVNCSIGIRERIR
jgi:hypothetical protein